MNVLIVDDEPLAREGIRRFLRDCADVTRVDDVSSGAQAVEALASGRWGVVFLDVQMPGLDGFDVLRGLAAAPPVVVFVTAHEQHAVDAFGVDAADYLLKPVSRERFQVALERVRARLRQRDVARCSEDLIAALRGLRDDAQTRELRLDDGRGVQVIPVESLIRVEADDKYVVLTGEDREWRIRRSLAQIVELLDPSEFLQVHRSCLVARSRIAGLDHTTGGVPFVTMVDGTRVRVSKARFAEVRASLLN